MLRGCIQLLDKASGEPEIFSPSTGGFAKLLRSTALQGSHSFLIILLEYLGECRRYIRKNKGQKVSGKSC